MNRPEVNQEVVLVNTHSFHARCDFGWKVKHVTPKTGAITITKTYAHNPENPVERKFNSSGHEIGKQYSRECLSLDVQGWRSRIAREDAQGAIANILNGIAKSGISEATRHWTRESLTLKIDEIQSKLYEAKALLANLPN